MARLPFGVGSIPITRFFDAQINKRIKYEVATRIMCNGLKTYLLSIGVYSRLSATLI